MLKLPKARRVATALAATTIAMAGLTATAADANAATRQPACGWINIGSPGNYTLEGSYAGQVEQEYNTCNGTVMAHWQWSTGYRNAHPYASVDVQAVSWGNYPEVTDQASDLNAIDNQNVYSGGTNIHNANPDEWFAYALVTGDDGASCRYAAGGSVHAYANGSDPVAASPSSC
ncbi:hypothetical protein [Streptacidiphilus jiangxiensis]|uniref:Peptidase inhibitor family I36 n=1 Tax=Streptacidiphilus jiangxiensis TaxID=235985 RepID=A0A1H7L862_STRJI|nr:hypothetical protein [Streptacidiphilus jiangxiensis]SEK95159.1 hypothetical protein SAMN05414137_104388 [Streptacidiphilus jiangxiensis]